MTAELDDLIHETADWLRIPSISAGARNDEALLEAAQWAQRRVLAAGGTCDLVDTPGGAPLVVGELKARDDAPTVLIYGHYDVQDPGDESEWTTPPFEPDIRDGRLYARGACDDKGNFLPLLHVACAMADAGELPLNVRVLIEGAEETGGDDVNRWVEADERGADCAIVFDSAMLDADTPALTVATRGMVFAHLTVRTGERPAHSGMYGGAALNALHALHTARCRPAHPGAAAPGRRAAERRRARRMGLAARRRRGPRRGGRRARRHGRRRRVLRAHDGRCLARRAPHRRRPDAHDRAPEARCDLSVRLAPGQDPATIAAALEELLRGALPAGAELELKTGTASPSRFDPAAAPLRIARAAMGRACGREPALIRSGGTLPILASFAERGIPAVVSGFGLPQDNLHAPDESFRLESIELGRRSARALYEDLGAGLARGA